MACITISRQMGSHGARIAKRLAKRLGWQFADKSTINEVLGEYGLIRLDEIYGDEPPKFRDLFDQDTMWTIEWMNKTIAAIAATRDVVILGRGGYAVLKGYSDVLNVLITAPKEVRADRILRDRPDKTDDDAVRRIEKDDDTRRTFVRRFYGAKWADQSQFDLVLDTGQISDDEAVDQLVAAQAERIASVSGPSVRDLEVDPVLLDTIDDVLGRRNA